MELCDFSSHLYTKLSIEVGERFVHQEYLGFTNDSTTERNSLSLTTGKSLRLSFEKMFNIKDTSCFMNSLVDFFLGSLTKLKTECHVFKYGHMRIKSIVLENHCNISVLGSDVVNETIADVKFAFCDFFQTCNHTESCGLTATGRTNHDDEFLILDFKIEVMYGCYTAGISLVNVLK